MSFYTGLPTYEVLEATFIHVSSFVKRRTQRLSLLQEMIMVLMKLRLNVLTKTWPIDLEYPSQQCPGHLHTGYSLWMYGCPH